MRAVALCCAVLVSPGFANGQGFINLNFEQANVFPTAPGAFGSEVPPAAAFPGWTVTAPFTLHNNLTLGSPSQVLVGPQFPNAIGLTPLQGSYSALLQFGPLPEMGMAGPSLSQTGLVPADAQSITFLAVSGSMTPVLTLNGTELPLAPLGGSRMGGDVSGFAGQQVQLTIATRDYSAGPFALHLDDITFSPTPVPEPNTWGLIAAGLLAGLYLRRAARRLQSF